MAEVVEPEVSKIGPLTMPTPFGLRPVNRDGIPPSLHPVATGATTDEREDPFGMMPLQGFEDSLNRRGDRSCNPALTLALYADLPGLPVDIDPPDQRLLAA